MLELYHWEPNGSYLKPLIALHEKGLPFASRYVDVLAFEQYQPGFLAGSRETGLNPEGEGPVLVHDGRQITESLFMIEYLEDAFPEKPLRPSDALSQARIPMKHLQEGWRLALTDGYCADLLQDSERKVKLSVQRIEDALAQSAWLVGSFYSLADIDAFAIC